ncbi:MAG TPA: GNAT family N-acetyltransferase [Pseudonocardiaceae bacterium]|nr:GNAT family N-acetyltransferase [Pseudonocardiaceae bacterium]
MTTAALSAWNVVWQGCAAYAAGGATVVQDDRIRWFATGVDYEGLNGVFIRPGTPAVPVEDALRTFQRMRVPALWHVGVVDRPGAEPIAGQPGASWYEEEPLMVAPVGQHEMPAVDRLSIIPVHDIPGIQAWVRMWSGGGDGPGLDPTVRARIGAGPAFVHLLAVLAGVPVGCAAAFVGSPDRVGGEVQHVMTVPGVRGRGIGTALTVAAMRAISARGLGTAVLTSSPDGLRIYRRLGFVQVGTMRRYLWSPSAAERAGMITRPDGARNIAAPSSDVTGRGGYPA